MFGLTGAGGEKAGTKEFQDPCEPSVLRSAASVVKRLDGDLMYRYASHGVRTCLEIFVPAFLSEESYKNQIKIPYFPQKPVEISCGMCYDYPV